MRNSELQEKVIKEVSASLFKKVDESPLTLDKIAHKAKMSKGYLNQLKSGERRLNIFYLYKISEALELRPSELLPLEWQKPNETDINPEALADAIHDIMYLTDENNLSLYEKAELVAKLYPHKIEKPGIINTDILTEEESTSKPKDTKT